MRRYTANCAVIKRGIYQDLCKVLIDDTMASGSLKLRGRLKLHKMLFTTINPELKREYYDMLVSLHPARKGDIKYLLETVEKGFIYQNESSIAVRASSRSRAKELLENNKKALEDCFGVIASLSNKAEKGKGGSGRGRFKKDYRFKRLPL